MPVERGARFIPLGQNEPVDTAPERYIDPDPNADPPQRWVFIERSAHEPVDKDMYLGPFETDEDAVRCMEESLLVEGELQPPRGGTDCFVTSDFPDMERDEVVLIDHNDPLHTGRTEKED